jgi:hypothetical protein
MKLVRVVTVSLNETHSEILLREHLSCDFPIQNYIKQ